MKEEGSINQLLRIHRKQRVKKQYQKPEEGFALDKRKQEMRRPKIDENKERHSTNHKLNQH
jgi:hypothetical protein